MRDEDNRYFSGNVRSFILEKVEKGSCVVADTGHGGVVVNIGIVTKGEYTSMRHLLWDQVSRPHNA